MPQFGSIIECCCCFSDIHHLRQFLSLETQQPLYALSIMIQHLACEKVPCVMWSLCQSGQVSVTSGQCNSCRSWECPLLFVDRRVGNAQNAVRGVVHVISDSIGVDYFQRNLYISWLSPVSGTWLRRVTWKFFQEVSDICGDHIRAA